MKERKNIIICLLVVLAFYACNNKYYDPDELIEIEYVGVSDTLKGEKLNTQFGVVSKLFFVNTYLVGLTSQSSHFLEVCRPEYDTCVVSFGEFGRSRNDFVDMPYDVHARDTKRGPELYIADGGSSITKVVDLELSFKKGRTVVKKVIKRPSSICGYEYHVIQKSEKDYAFYKELSYHDSRDHIYFTPSIGFNKQGEETVYDLYPKILPIDDYDILSAAYAGDIEVRPDLAKCVLVHRFIDLIDIVDLDKQTVTGVKVKESYNFDYFTTIKDASLVAESLKAFNINASVTDNYIFQLKSDMTIKEMMEIEVNEHIPYHSTVVVSDWEGKVLRSFVINEVLRAIAYDEKSEFLYGVDNYGCLFRYKVSLK
ncbi:hypothetical protein L6472_00470 [Prevotella sp. E13-17]|uniref:hypothetical protein n=1 Tax=Prevotella sp. E13-17 TaxID=2913616 RepID=UPI001EDC650F|nr:hypothetical protein [Prevotella sp. E13-17]UKK51105.1 hypothetical protein L6472_00470 [Prevotella sp. E13-17]